MIEKFPGRETAEIHLMGKAGESYKVAGLEPVGDIKMTDGVTDWTVSVTSDDNNDVYNTLHINAYLAKFLVETILFILNFIIEQKFIFNERCEKI